MYSRHLNNCYRYREESDCVDVCVCMLMIEFWQHFLCLCLKVYELTLHYTQHWDHNVVTAALELLQQMFRTPPPELLHMLITAGSIPHATVFRQDTESRARSGSILELIGKHINQLGLCS